MASDVGELTADLKKVKTHIGAGFKKGSPEAKEHMARLRAMRKNK